MPARTLAFIRSAPGRLAYFRRMKERTALNHANIVRIYDIDEQQGRVLMESVMGMPSIARLNGLMVRN